MQTLNNILTSGGLPYGADAPVREDLRRLGFVDLRAYRLDESSVKSERSRIRYLAALLPDLDLPRLAEAIAGIISNDDLSLSDVRVILEGRYLSDASKRTGEVPVESIQTAGRLLSAGANISEVARQSRISVDTVRAIDDYLGLSERYEDGLMDWAVTSVREGWSVSRLAEASGMSRSRAHRYQVRAREVLAEIGELS